MFYPLYADPNKLDVSLTKTDRHTVEIYPRNSQGEDGCWTWGLEKATNYTNLLVANHASTGKWSVFRKDYLEGTSLFTKSKALWLEKEMNHENGKEMMGKLFGKTIKLMEDWPEKKREEFIHKMKKFRNYLNRKAIDKKTLSDIGITVHIMSTIIEFLMVKANAKHIYWISDRDTITSFQDGIVHEFIRLGCASLLNRRIPDDQMYGFVDAKEYDKEICDEFIRVPDYICGSLASMDFNNVEEIPDKHYDLFDKSIVDNERIFIMNIKHGENEDTLSDLKFTRS